MYHFTDAQAKSAIETDIREREALYPYFEIVARTLRKFDGKCYNKHLPNAIMTETENKFYCYQDSYNSDLIRCYCRLNNAGRSEITIFQFKKTDLPGNKRIDAAAIIADLKEHLTDLYNSVQKMKTALKTIDFNVARYRRYLEDAQEIARDMPYNICEYFGLKQYL